METNKNKNLIITGGTRGMGLSHAFYLSSKGYNLALIDISKKACQVYGEIKNVNDFAHKEIINIQYRIENIITTIKNYILAQCKLIIISPLLILTV